MMSNVPVGVTGSNPSISNRNCPTKFRDELLAIQTLEGYVLPILSSTPLYIHKMQLKLKVLPEYYHEISNPSNAWNKGKRHEEIVGNTIVTYQFYSNGIIMISVGSSNKPFKVEDDVDRGRLLAFFGQVRDRLVLFLMDKRERVVPDVMQWELTQFDLNRDVKVSDWMQVTGIKMQIRHLDHLFRIYIIQLEACKGSTMYDTINRHTKPKITLPSDKRHMPHAEYLHIHNRRFDEYNLKPVI